MSGLVIRDKNGENISYSGTQFEGLEDLGSRHLCVRTGSGAGDVVKYALTSKPLNDKYKALRMRIADGASGKEAYIAQRYVESRTVSVSTSCTSSRSSQYTTIETLTSASSSRSSTTNTTRSVTQSPVYYGSQPMVMVGTKIGRWYGGNNTSTYTTNDDCPPKDFTAYSPDYSYSISASNVRFIPWASFSSNGSLTSSSAKFHTELGNGGDWKFTITARSEIVSSDRSATIQKSLSYPHFTVTETRTSRASNYTTTTRLSTASKSSTRTATASRSSEYTSSTSASSTESFTSHNVDL